MKKNKNKTTETDLNGAGATVDGWGEPVDCTIAENQHVDIERNIELTIVTAEADGKTNMALYLIPATADFSLSSILFCIAAAFSELYAVVSLYFFYRSHTQPCHSLVDEVDVGTPHLAGRNPQNLDVVVLLWVP